MFLPRTVLFFFHVYFFPSACGLVDTMAPSFYFKDSAIINFMEKTLSSSLRRKTEFFKHEKGKSKPSSLHLLLYSRLSVPVGLGDTRGWDGD